MNSLLKRLLKLKCLKSEPLELSIDLIEMINNDHQCNYLTKNVQCIIEDIVLLAEKFYRAQYLHQRTRQRHSAAITAHQLADENYLDIMNYYEKAIDEKHYSKLDFKVIHKCRITTKNLEYKIYSFNELLKESSRRAKLYEEQLNVKYKTLLTIYKMQKNQ